MANGIWFPLVNYAIATTCLLVGLTILQGIRRITLNLHEGGSRTVEIDTPAMRVFKRRSNLLFGVFHLVNIAIVCGWTVKILLGGGGFGVAMVIWAICLALGIWQAVAILGASKSRAATSSTAGSNTPA